MRVKLLRPIKHGEFYKPGDVVDVSEKSAARLIRIKAAEKTTGGNAAPPPSGKQAPEYRDDDNDTASGSGGGNTPEKPVDEMSKDELEAELSNLGMFQPGMKTSELKALLKKAKAQ